MSVASVDRDYLTSHSTLFVSQQEDDDMLVPNSDFPVEGPQPMEGIFLHLCITILPPISIYVYVCVIYMDCY